MSALPGIHVGRGKPHCLVEVGFHDRNEALHVRLLVDLDLDVAIDFICWTHFRHKVEAAEQHFAGRDAAVRKHARDSGVPEARVEIGGRVRDGR